jgi:hypothetical protein
VNLKRKYAEGSDKMDGIATTAVNQNLLIEMRGSLVPSNPVKHILSYLLPMIKNTPLVLMSSAGPVARGCSLSKSGPGR